MDEFLPSFSFTIPSVHDGCELQCRIYLPSWLRNIGSAPAWSVRGAIVAHPYAPLGGCYDDPVVSFLGSELYQQGYVVGTFNFRCGALLTRHQIAIKFANSTLQRSRGLWGTDELDCES